MTAPVDLDRLDALLLSASTPSDGDGFCRGCGKIDTRCECMDMIADAYPALSAELRALRAEVETLRGLRNLPHIHDDAEAEVRTLRAENERLRAVRDAAEATYDMIDAYHDDGDRPCDALVGLPCDCGAQPRIDAQDALRAALDAAAGGA